MARSSTRSSKDKKNGGANLGFESTLWLAADKLRNNLDAAEYKHVVPGIIFLKYISDAFIDRRAELLSEVAFYEALEINDSAVKVLGDETLKAIARELVQTVRQNVTIDWTMKETVRARLRSLVRRTLRRYGYPPDMQEKATRTVLEQAELLGEEWVGGSSYSDRYPTLTDP